MKTNREANRMASKNKGFSLVEMIITIAIISIVTTGSLVISRRIGYADTMKAAKTVDSAMDKLRLETMSKDKRQYMYLYKVDNSIYMKVSSDPDAISAGLDSDSGKKLGSNISISVDDPSGTDRLIGDGENISISFTRSSGAFTSNYEYIKFIYSTNTSVIHCIIETGRHWVG